MLLRYVPDTQRYGRVRLDSRLRVREFQEKVAIAGPGWVNAGSYAMTRSLVESIPVGLSISLESALLPTWIAEQRVIQGLPSASYWMDVGTPNAVLQASLDVMSGCLPDAFAPEVKGSFSAVDVHLSPDSYVAPTARIDDGVRVTRSVVWDGAWLKAGSHVTDSLVGCKAQVGARAVLNEAYIGDCEIVPPAAIRRGTAPETTGA